MMMDYEEIKERVLRQQLRDDRKLTTDELCVGCELDALVAEMVMRWRKYLYNEPGSTITDEADIWFEPNHNGHCWKGEPFEIGGRWDRSFRHWSPSTNIADAFEVVDLMIEYAHDFELTWNGPMGNESWLCCFLEPALANTPALAICRAALATS